jgi:hypothetical protein
MESAMPSRLDYLERLTVAIDLYRDPDKVKWKDRSSKELIACLAAAQVGLISACWDEHYEGIRSAIMYIGNMPDSDKEYTLLRPSEAMLMQIEIEKGFEDYCALHAG